jgi:hypothetical protein
MKKNILFLLFIIAPLLSFSQDKTTSFGVKGGFIYSNAIDNMELSMPTHIPAKYNGKIGFQIGGYANIKINNKVSIQPELLVTKSGSKATIAFKDLGGVYTSQDNVFYQFTKAEINEYNIQIPVLLNFNFEKLFLEIGPQFGYTIKRDISYTDAPLNTKFILKNEASDNFEISANLGVGYYLSNRYKANIRYGYGITKKQNLQSSILSLGVAYQL